MTDKEVMQMALDIMESAIKAGDWVVDGACDPDLVLNALRARLAQPEPAECDGGQCGIGGHCKECPKTQLEQEPVAWMYKGEPWFDGTIWHDQSEVTTHKRVAMFKDKNAKLLYTTPPQREWVGLTDEDMDELIRKFARYELIRAIEAKLKKKNGLA